MEHARKMALVDTRLLDTLRSPPPPRRIPWVRRCMTSMMSILDRKELDYRTKVHCIIRCCSGTTSCPINTSRNQYAWSRRMSRCQQRRGRGGEASAEGAERAPSIEDYDTVPKAMPAKDRRLMEHLKRDIAWTTRIDTRRYAGCVK